MGRASGDEGMVQPVKSRPAVREVLSDASWVCRRRRRIMPILTFEWAKY